MAKLSDYNFAMADGDIAADIGGLGSTASPSYIKLVSADGTARYIFAANDGTLRQATSAPTSNTSGSEVTGNQGAAGAQGATGAQGNQGSQGSQGNQGNQA